MERAAVLIGVKKTGDLPVLRDATRSALRMKAWAQLQGFEHVAAFTDEDGAEVEVSQIKRAIRDLSELGTVEQLIVFFAGHGININKSERWLLSGAPDDPQAAINVSGSVELARWGGIPYVVMISDACRTAAQSIRAQAVSGSEIFPNADIAEFELPVDQFFACRLGRPAYEIADGTTSAREYRAIYTAALLSALRGEDPFVLDALGYVRPRPLKRFLLDEVTRQLRDRDLQTKLIQTPDAHISSGDEEWIAYVEPAAPHPPAVEPHAPPPTPDPFSVYGCGGDVDDLGTIAGAVDAILRPVARGWLDEFSYRLSETRESSEPRIADLARWVEDEAAPFGPMHFETECGIKVRGAEVREAVASLETERLSGDVVRVHPRYRHGATVLLVLERGIGVAVQAISGYITSVTVEGDEVVAVAYEPSEGTGRWQDFSDRASEVRYLRATAAMASREGAFELEGEDAVETARRMQYVKSIDPALAVYAAYTYADTGHRTFIREMRAIMGGDLGAALFDIAMLARWPRDDPRTLWGTETFGFAPLLAQGWALMPALWDAGPMWLQELGRHVLPTSLWTAYDERGVDLIRAALADGTVQ